MEISTTKLADAVTKTIDMRDAAVEVLTRMGWAWRDDAWVRGNTRVDATGAQTSRREQLEDERWRLMNNFGHATYADGLNQRRIDEIDTQLAALDRQGGPASADDSCQVCAPEGLHDQDGNGPYRCYACGKAPGDPAPTRRYGIDIPHGWKLVPFDLTEEMVRAFVDARENPQHPAYRGEFPRDSASWDAALGAAPALENSPPDTRITLVPVEPPFASLREMSIAMAGRDHADKVFPWNAQREAWKNGLLQLTALAQHIAEIWTAGDLVRADQAEGTAITTGGAA